MLSVENKIINKIKKCGIASAFFALYFATFGNSTAVNKPLELLVQSKIPIHITQRTYFHPQIDKVLGLGILQPSLETIAKNIAKRDKTRIIPTKSYNPNLLVLLTQVVATTVLPSAATEKGWCETMIYDNSTTFEELIQKIKKLNNTINYLQYE